jgi:hypothetical protein
MTEIATEFFVLSSEQYDELYPESQKLNVTLDYYLLEFVTIEGSDVEYNGDEWVEVDNH